MSTAGIAIKTFERNPQTRTRVYPMETRDIWYDDEVRFFEEGCMILRNDGTISPSLSGNRETAKGLRHKQALRLKTHPEQWTARE